MNTTATDIASEAAPMAPASPHQPGYLERAILSLPLGLGPRLAPLLAGDGLKAKAMRGSAWTVIGFGTGQLLRLGSNPEHTVTPTDPSPRTNASRRTLKKPEGQSLRSCR